MTGADRKEIIAMAANMVWKLAGRELVSWGGLGRDDLYQEGMLGLILALRRYDPKRNDDPLKFAWKRVRGAMIDAKRNYSEYNRSKNVDGSRAPTIVSILDECNKKVLDKNLSIDQCEMEDLLIDLANCVEKLPYKQKTAIELIFYRGLTFNEAAGILKLRREAVWFIIGLGLRNLRKCLLK